MLSAYKEKIEIRYFYPSQDDMNKKTPEATVPLRRYFLNHITKCCTVPQELLSQFTQLRRDCYSFLGQLLEYLQGL
jgi:hypothetical protein